MPYQITVALPDGKEFEFNIVDSDLAGLGRDGANVWLDNEWIALECAPLSPVGKVLLLDKMLSIAKYSGARRFQHDAHWGRQFARCVAVLLDRPAVRVDVPELSVG
jgi:hypothetical protein